MKFRIVNEAQCKSVVVYRLADRSFDMDKWANNSEFDIVVNDVSVGIDFSGLVVSIWGFSALESWKETDIELDDMQTTPYGGIRLADVGQLAPGVSVRLNETEAPIFFNKSSGWLRICIRTNFADEQRSRVKIFDNVIAELLGGELTALVVCPKFV